MREMLERFISYVGTKSIVAVSLCFSQEHARIIFYDGHERHLKDLQAFG